MSDKENAWAEQHTFRDKDGREVNMFEIVEGPERGKQVFKGKVLLTMRVSPDPRVPPQKVPFEFDFPEGKSFTWVRKHFDEEAQKAVTQFEKDQKEAQAEAAKKIVTAKDMPGLLGPNGRKI